jgi:hypothetical protein
VGGEVGPKESMPGLSELLLLPTDVNRAREGHALQGEHEAGDVRGQDNGMLATVLNQQPLVVHVDLYLGPGAVSELRLHLLPSR